jgi:transcriptional regulator with XRE-family HTH domain
MIDAAQIRAARALLNINQADLARRAFVHVATIRRLEAATEIRGAAETLWKIQTALEAAGIEFISPEVGKGPGVRLKTAPRQAQKPRAKRKR